MYSTIINPTWLSIVFENRNQQYGAFQLRKEYERNLLGGLVISHLSLAGFFGAIWLCYALAPKEIKAKVEDIPFVVTDVILEPLVKIEPPKEIPKLIEKVKTIAYLPPKVVPNDLAIDVMPTETEIVESVISTKTQEGEKGVDTNPIDLVGTANGSEIVPSDQVVLIADEMPTFPAEYGSITSFLAKRIKYPSMAIANSVSGRVYVEFVIDENGKLILPKILKGLGYGCDEEVLRILALVPQWRPGKMNGKGVKVKMNIPVSFKITE